ncbi:MAG: TolC family protein [Gemmataceae bacterium]
MQLSPLRQRWRGSGFRVMALRLGLAILPTWGGSGALLQAQGVLPPVVMAPSRAGPEAHYPPIVEHSPAAQQVRLVPISLDTVLRLAEESNPDIALAREQLREACLEREVAAKRWLPDLYLGTAFYRHEGGIQDFRGPLIHSSTGALFNGLELNGRFDIRDIAFHQVNAERKTWQQKGELAKITNERLLDAAETYIDLLAARTGEQVALDLMHDTEKLLERTRKLAATEPAVQVQVHAVQSLLYGQQQRIVFLQDSARSLSAKLVNLLGLDPCIELVPVDTQLVPFELVNVDVPTCDLVARSLAQGPGVREMEGLLHLVHENIERARGPGRFLPIFEVRMAQGGFGAGPGSSMDWDNRWDMGLQMRWNLTELAALKERRRVTQSRLCQLHMAHAELRRKLIIGVQTVQQSILNARQQIDLGEKQIEQAREVYKLSDQRFQNLLEDSSALEVANAIRYIGEAQLGYLSAIREYDKNHVRMLLLLGVNNCPPLVGHVPDAPPAPNQLPNPPGHGQ